MGKSLSEMSLEELWQLFPIVLKEYNVAYHKWYLEEKNELGKIIGYHNIKRISHIGSSAVKGLLAKPIIDILLEVDKACNIEQLKIMLKNSNWLPMSSESNPALKLSFNKGYTKKGFAEKVFHLHVRYLGDWDELYFRDYLIEYHDIAIEYGKLKMILKEKYEHNRDAYTNAKGHFIEKYSKIAKKRYKNKYMPNDDMDNSI